MLSPNATMQQDELKKVQIAMSYQALTFVLSITLALCSSAVSAQEPTEIQNAAPADTSVISGQEEGHQEASQRRSDPSGDKAVEQANENQERELAAQESMARYSRSTLIASWAAVLLSSIGIFVVWRTLAETAKATKLLGQDFIAANPPVIKVFQAHLDFDAIMEGSKPPFGGVYVVNTGGSEAKITGSSRSDPPTYGNIVLFIGRNPPDRKPFELARFANPLAPQNGVLKAGDSQWWNIDDISMIDPAEIKTVINQETDNRIFIIGRIHFADTRDNRRQTVFCRVYDQKTGRFTAAGVEDYEYQA